MITIDANTFRVQSWIELQEQLFDDKDQSVDRFRSRFVYRGVHKSSHNLDTSLQRMGRVPSETEEHIIRNFQKYAPVNTLTGEYDNIWNWIALGQHYGLPTRLLDWTFSPNVALHFMADFDKGFKEDGIIWMIDFIEARQLMPQALKKKILDKKFLTFTPRELTLEIGNSIDQIRSFTMAHGNSLFFMEPPSIDDRIVNQFALFSFMLDPDVDKQVWIEDRPSLYKKLIIPAALKWEIRDKLDQANISERVIYPGLAGISKWLNRWYSEKDGQKAWKPDRSSTFPK